MKENKREGSIVTTVARAIIFFLILALFGKSVHSSEIPTSNSTQKNQISLFSNNNVQTAENSFTQAAADHYLML